MSKKILSIIILLVLVILSGCAVIQEQGPNGTTRTRVEILGPSMNVGYGMNRGYPVGYGVPGNAALPRGDGFVDMYGPNGYRGSYDTRFAIHPHPYAR